MSDTHDKPPSDPGALQARDVCEVSAPAIILVRPQLGENIGMAARAMANFAMTELRLVKPRDGWPNADATAAAAGADGVIDNAVVYESVRDAVGDLGGILR